MEVSNVAATISLPAVNFGKLIFFHLSVKKNVSNIPLIPVSWTIFGISYNIVEDTGIISL